MNKIILDISSTPLGRLKNEVPYLKSLNIDKKRDSIINMLISMKEIQEKEECFFVYKDDNNCIIDVVFLFTETEKIFQTEDLIFKEDNNNIIISIKNGLKSQTFIKNKLDNKIYNIKNFSF